MKFCTCRRVLWLSIFLHYSAIAVVDGLAPSSKIPSIASAAAAARTVFNKKFAPPASQTSGQQDGGGVTTNDAPSSRLYYRDRNADDEEFTENALGRRQRSQSHRQPKETIKASSPSSVSITSNEVGQQEQQLNPQQQGTQQHQPQQHGLNMPLIRAIWYNQGAILLFATAVVTCVAMLTNGPQHLWETLTSLHWNNNGAGNFHSLFDWHITPARVLEGIAATFPMIALGGLVENSDHRDASHVNFSTTNMVISLFGRRRTRRKSSLMGDTDNVASPTTCTSDVMWLSGAIALSTGISEELVFRGYIPTAILGMTGSVPMAVFGQAALFALGHVSPKVNMGENRVVGGLQFANALWYATVYMVTGGDIIPCLIAHILYDMHIFCETWMTINRQMDYTEQAYLKRLDETEESAISRLQQQAGPTILSTDTLNFARRFFYAFDHDHMGSLSLSDVQRAVTYAFLHHQHVPTPEDVKILFDRMIVQRQLSDSMHNVPHDRLSMSEFLRVLFALKSKTAAASAQPDSSTRHVPPTTMPQQG